MSDAGAVDLQQYGESVYRGVLVLEMWRSVVERGGCLGRLVCRSESTIVGRVGLC